jgi:hypothetical protein
MMIIHLIMNIVDPTCLFRKCEIETEIVDRRSIERLSIQGNRFENQGLNIWKAGVASMQEGHSEGWLASPMAYYALPCMFEHMKRVNPDATVPDAAFAETQLIANTQRPPAIVVGDSLPLDEPMLPEAAGVSVPTPLAPLNKFKRSLPMLHIPKNPKAAARTSGGLPPQSSPMSQRQSGTESELGDLGDSASAFGAETQEDSQSQMGYLPSRERLETLKQKLPLQALMNGIKLGRQERTVRLALNSSTLDDSDKKLLRNHLKLAPNAMKQ